MHILTLMVTLSLAFPTLFALRTIHLRADQSLLSRRASPPRARPQSPERVRPGLANNSGASHSEPWMLLSSTSIPRTTYANAKGNRFASLSSDHNSYSYRLPSHHTNQHVAFNSMRSTASVENDSARAEGTVKAQGQKLKFKSSTSNGSALFRAYGPGSVTAALERTLAQNDDLSSFGRTNLAIGQQQDFRVQPHSKLIGEMHFNELYRSLPRIEGTLVGEGKMNVKAKDA